jgi:glycosyltransferase involved in cell wall biosynthesis
MKVAWLHDEGNADGTKGGAELTMDGFRKAAPESVEFTPDADTVVIGNCVTFQPEIIYQLEGKRVIRYHHDLSHAEHPRLREWLDENANHVFTSPLHREHYQSELEGEIIPPAVDLERLRPNRQQRRHGKRQGIVTIASWQNPNKGGHLVSETLFRQGLQADCYGHGPHVPYGDHIHDQGPYEQADLPQILWKYEQFIFLPNVIEPFGRCVVEAWAAGLEILTNDLVCSKYYLEEDQAALETAAQDFWEYVSEA